MPESAGKLATDKKPSTAGTTATAETPATAWIKATAGKPTTPGTPTKAGNQAIVRTSETKGTPAAAEMLATSDRHSIAGVQATTATPRAAEMPETVLTPTIREFSQKFSENSSERRNFMQKIQEKRVKIALFCQSLSDSYWTIGSPVLLVRYLKPDSCVRPIFRLFFLIAIEIS